jgi:chemotaxis-related protein WspB
MLVLSFEVGPSRFALDARRVVQVVPRVPLRSLPLAEHGLAGLLDLGGTVLPVLDLGLRFHHQPCADRLSTRIVVVRVPHAGRDVPLGLVAERVIDLHELDEARTPPPDANVEGAGRVLRLGTELVQWIEPAALLPEHARVRLYDTILGDAG